MSKMNDDIKLLEQQLDAILAESEPKPAPQTKTVTVLPTDNQLKKGAMALKRYSDVSWMSSTQLRAMAAVVYQSMVGQPSTQMIENNSPSRYEKYLEFNTDALAQLVKSAAKKRDGLDLEVVGTNMYFFDKFDFDHICYHYKNKIQPGQVSIKTVVDEETPSVASMLPPVVSPSAIKGADEKRKLTKKLAIRSINNVMRADPENKLVFKSGSTQNSKLLVYHDDSYLTALMPDQVSAYLTQKGIPAVTVAQLQSTLRTIM